MKQLPLTIEGLDYEVRWGKFKPLTSMFFPCLNTKRAVVELRRLSRIQKIQVVIREVIEDGFRGVRIWRV